MTPHELARRKAAAIQRADRPLGELVSDMTHDLGMLVRDEVALAKAEMREGLKKIMTGAIAAAAGATVAYAGVLTLIAAWALGLVRLGAPAWAAVLLIGGVVTIVGGALIWYAIGAFKKASPVPHRAVENVKHSLQRVKDEVT
jgi:hypothetical protein